jgi:hypothetical protein
VIDTRKPRLFVPSVIHRRNVSIRLEEPDAIEASAASRGTSTVHPYTQEVLDAVVEEVRRPE